MLDVYADASAADAFNVSKVISVLSFGELKKHYEDQVYLYIYLLKMRNQTE